MKDRNDTTAAQAAQIEKIEERYNRTVDSWTGDRGYDGPEQDVMLVDFERQPGERRVSADIARWHASGFDAELTTWVSGSQGSPATWLN